MSAVLPIALTLYGQQVQNLSIATGATVQWVLDLEDPITRDPIDLTSPGTAVQLSWAALDIKGNPALPPLFSHQATIPGSPTNRCTVLQTSGDTVPSGTPLTPGAYAVDVWMTDSSGNRLQSMGTAVVELTAAVTLPGAPVTPSPPEQPLGQGPNVTRYANLAAFPSASTATNLLAFATDTSKLYISNGTSWLVIVGGP